MNQPPKAKLFIEGRYLKHTRDLPQTLFFCPKCKGHERRRRGCPKCEGFGKLTKDSVQELIAWVIGKAAGTRKNKFHGAGREDIDVRMLGEGRPFVFELVNPKVTGIDLAELEATINSRNEGRMEVRGLHWSQKGRVRFLKEGHFAKDYQARVEVVGEIDPEVCARLRGHRYEVAQKTPSRVAHRRADKVRDRWIEILAIEPEEPGHVVVSLRTQHGTYVKEAISGEGGMSSPSVAELMGVESALCVALDVTRIHDEDERPEASPTNEAAGGSSVGAAETGGGSTGASPSSAPFGAGLGS